jgi:hypothetical protein
MYAGLIVIGGLSAAAFNRSCKFVLALTFRSVMQAGVSMFPV